MGTASFSASVYDASIKEAELRVEKLQRDYDRHTKLLAKNASTPVIVEQCKSELDMANARVAAMRQQREAARSSVGEVSQRRENAEAAIQRAQAAVDMARLNQSYTVITASVSVPDRHSPHSFPTRGNGLWQTSRRRRWQESARGRR